MGNDGTSEPILGEPHAPPNLELASTRPSFFQRYGLSEILAVRGRLSLLGH